MFTVKTKIEKPFDAYFDKNMQNKYYERSKLRIELIILYLFTFNRQGTVNVGAIFWYGWHKKGKSILTFFCNHNPRQIVSSLDMHFKRIIILLLVVKQAVRIFCRPKN